MKKILSLFALLVTICSYAQESEAIVVKKSGIPMAGGVSGTTNRVIGIPLGGGVSGTTAKIIRLPLSAGTSGTTNLTINIPVGGGVSGTTAHLTIYEIQDVNSGELFSTVPTDLEISVGQRIVYTVENK